MEALKTLTNLPLDTLSRRPASNKNKGARLNVLWNTGYAAGRSHTQNLFCLLFLQKWIFFSLSFSNKKNINKISIIAKIWQSIHLKNGIRNEPHTHTRQRHDRRTYTFRCGKTLKWKQRKTNHKYSIIKMSSNRERRGEVERGGYGDDGFKCQR